MKRRNQLVSTVHSVVVKMLVIAGLFSSASASADSAHDWDHIGTSYAVNTFLYGVSHKAFGFSKRDAVLFSLVGTFIFTTVYSVNNNITKAQLGRDVGMNMIGAGLSAGTVLMFDF